MQSMIDIAQCCTLVQFYPGCTKTLIEIYYLTATWLSSSVAQQTNILHVSRAPDQGSSLKLIFNDRQKSRSNKQNLSSLLMWVQIGALPITQDYTYTYM